MKPIIGIIVRKDNNKYYLNENIIKVVEKYNGIPLGIFNEDYDLIDKCDGIILPGGDDIIKKDLNIINYLYKKDIPTLGICLGMQEMGYLFNGKMNDVSNYNHLKKYDRYAHNINIIKNSKLYEIIGEEKIKVNSRHKDYLISTDLTISSISDVIESIEDKNKRFFIGVQWHPEDMLDYDTNSNKLFENFIKSSTKNI